MVFLSYVFIMQLWMIGMTPPGPEAPMPRFRAGMIADFAGPWSWKMWMTANGSKRVCRNAIPVVSEAVQSNVSAFWDFSDLFSLESLFEEPVLTHSCEPSALGKVQDVWVGRENRRWTIGPLSWGRLKLHQPSHRQWQQQQEQRNQENDRKKTTLNIADSIKKPFENSHVKHDTWSGGH